MCRLSFPLLLQEHIQSLSAVSAYSGLVLVQQVVPAYMFGSWCAPSLLDLRISGCFLGQLMVPACEVSGFNCSCRSTSRARYAAAAAYSGLFPVQQMVPACMLGS